MMKRIVESNNKEEVIVKRKDSLVLVVSFCFLFFIITISFLIITKFSFINSIILSGVFLSSVYIFLFLLISILPSLKKRGGGRFYKIHPDLPLYKDRWVNLYKGRSLKTKKCI